MRSFIRLSRNWLANSRETARPAIRQLPAALRIAAGQKRRHAADSFVNGFFHVQHITVSQYCHVSGHLLFTDTFVIMAETSINEEKGVECCAV